MGLPPPLAGEEIDERKALNAGGSRCGGKGSLTLHLPGKGDTGPILCKPQSEHPWSQAGSACEGHGQHGRLLDDDSAWGPTGGPIGLPVPQKQPSQPGGPHVGVPDVRAHTHTRSKVVLDDAFPLWAGAEALPVEPTSQRWPRSQGWVDLVCPRDAHPPCPGLGRLWVLPPPTSACQGLWQVDGGRRGLKRVLSPPHTANRMYIQPACLP